MLDALRHCLAAHLARKFLVDLAIELTVLFKRLMHYGSDVNHRIVLTEVMLPPDLSANGQLLDLMKTTDMLHERATDIAILTRDQYAFQSSPSLSLMTCR